MVSHLDQTNYEVENPLTPDTLGAQRLQERLQGKAVSFQFPIEEEIDEAMKTLDDENKGIAVPDAEEVTGVNEDNANPRDTLLNGEPQQEEHPLDSQKMTRTIIGMTERGHRGHDTVNSDPT